MEKWVGLTYLCGILFSLRILDIQLTFKQHSLNCVGPLKHGYFNHIILVGWIHRCGRSADVEGQLYIMCGLTPMLFKGQVYLYIGVCVCIFLSVLSIHNNFRYLNQWLKYYISIALSSLSPWFLEKCVLSLMIIVCGFLFTIRRLWLCFSVLKI